MFLSETFQIETPGRGTIEITDRADRIVRASNIQAGLANIFVHHTSASLIVCENADPTVRTDLERFFAKFAPDGDPANRHRDEGPDDMPAHIRSILTCASVAVPVRGGRLDLGTWQGIYLYEHRTSPHRRRVTVSMIG